MQSQNYTAAADNGRQRIGFFLPFLLIVMGSYPPLTTDLYLPALPEMAKNLNTSSSTANLTLVLFFVFFAVSTLVWGPVSQKFGRKPALIVGISLFTLSSAGCVVSTSIYQMIVWRVVQAIASGAPVTIALAIVQDTYKGDAKRTILAILGALTMIAPVVGPSLGAAILVFGNWRMIFALLAVVGALSLVGCLFLKESLEKGEATSLLQVFKGLADVLKHPFFRRALFIYSMPAVYAFGFIGGSALIFMTQFGVSPNFFSLCFATNAGVGILGSALYVPLIKRLGLARLSILTFAAIMLSGILILLFGHTHPVPFLLCVLPGSAMAALTKPLGMDPMLEAAKEDPGAASSLMTFFTFMVGSIGMQIVSLPWENQARVYGIMGIVIGIFCCAIWPWVASAMPDTFRR